MNLYFALGQNVYFLFTVGGGRIFYKCQLGEVVFAAVCVFVVLEDFLSAHSIGY